MPKNVSPTNWHVEVLHSHLNLHLVVNHIIGGPEPSGLDEQAPPPQQNAQPFRVEEGHSNSLTIPIQPLVMPTDELGGHLGGHAGPSNEPLGSQTQHEMWKQKWITTLQLAVSEEGFARHDVCPLINDAIYSTAQ